MCCVCTHSHAIRSMVVEMGATISMKVSQKRETRTPDANRSCPGAHPPLPRCCHLPQPPQAANSEGRVFLVGHTTLHTGPGAPAPAVISATHPTPNCLQYESPAGSNHRHQNHTSLSTTNKDQRASWRWSLCVVLFQRDRHGDLCGDCQCQGVVAVRACPPELPQQALPIRCLCLLLHRMRTPSTVSW